MDPTHPVGASAEGKSHTHSEPQLPHGWIIRVSKTYPDRVYYFNPGTGASCWELPGLPSSDQSHKVSGGSDTAHQASDAHAEKKKKKRKRRRSKTKNTTESSKINAEATAVKQDNRTKSADVTNSSHSSQSHSTSLGNSQCGAFPVIPLPPKPTTPSKPQEKHQLRRPLDMPVPFLKTSSTAQQVNSSLASQAVSGSRLASASNFHTNKLGEIKHQHQKSFSSASLSSGATSATGSQKLQPVAVRPEPLKARRRSDTRTNTSDFKSQAIRSNKPSAPVTRSQKVGTSNVGITDDANSRLTKRKSDCAQTSSATDVKRKLNGGPVKNMPDKSPQKCSSSGPLVDNSVSGGAKNTSQSTEESAHHTQRKKSKKSKSQLAQVLAVDHTNNKSLQSKSHADKSKSADEGKSMVQSDVKSPRSKTKPSSQSKQSSPQSEMSLRAQGTLVSMQQGTSFTPLATQNTTNAVGAFSAWQGAFATHQGALPMQQTTLLPTHGCMLKENSSFGPFTGVRRNTSCLSPVIPFPGFFSQESNPDLFAEFSRQDVISAAEKFSFVDVCSSRQNYHSQSGLVHEMGNGFVSWTPPYEEKESAVEMDDMEVDEEDGDQMMMDIQEIRGVRPDMHKVVGMLTERIQHSERPVTPVQSDGTSASQLVYVVLDTNVLMGALAFVQNLRDMWLKDLGRPYLIIPWVVLQELDALKGDNVSIKQKHNRKAQNAVRYLHSCFVSKHPRVRGQTPLEACEVFEHLPIQCNDDHILQCCVQCQKKYIDSCVMLLTNDMNLQNKAIVMGLDSSSTKSLMPLLAAKVESHSLETPHSDTVESTPQAVHEEPASTRGPSPMQKDDQQKERAVVDDLLCSVKAALEHCLKSVVETEMRAAYGDLWTAVIFKNPPWSAYDLICNFHKHWIAVFGIVFPRPLQTVVEDLASRLKPETATQLTLPQVHEVILRCQTLVQTIKVKDRYTQVAREAETLLEKLIGKIKGTQPPSLPQSTVTPPVLSPEQPAASNRTRSAGSVEMPEELGQPRSNINQPTPVQTTARSESHLLGQSNRGPSSRRAASNNQMTESADTSRRSFTPPLIADNDRKLQASVNNNSMKNSVGVTQLTPNYKLIIQDTFQMVWSAIFNCCNNIEGMQGRTMNNAELTEVKNTLTVLVPLVQQIHKEFIRCLGYSPLGLAGHTNDFVAFCSGLNGFFASTKIPAPDLPQITAPDMVAFMSDTSNRVTLLNGLKQLDDFRTRLQNIVSHLAS